MNIEAIRKVIKEYREQIKKTDSLPEFLELDSDIFEALLRRHDDNSANFVKEPDKDLLYSIAIDSDYNNPAKIYAIDLVEELKDVDQRRLYMIMHVLNVIDPRYYTKMRPAIKKLLTDNGYANDLAFKGMLSTILDLANTNYFADHDLYYIHSLTPELSYIFSNIYSRLSQNKKNNMLYNHFDRIVIDINESIKKDKNNINKISKFVDTLADDMEMFETNGNDTDYCIYTMNILEKCIKNDYDNYMLEIYYKYIEFAKKTNNASNYLKLIAYDDKAKGMDEVNRIGFVLAFCEYLNKLEAQPSYDIRYYDLCETLLNLSKEELELLEEYYIGSYSNVSDHKIKYYEELLNDGIDGFNKTNIKYLVSGNQTMEERLIASNYTEEEIDLIFDSLYDKIDLEEDIVPKKLKLIK